MSTFADEFILEIEISQKVNSAAQGSLKTSYPLVQSGLARPPSYPSPVLLRLFLVTKPCSVTTTILSPKRVPKSCAIYPQSSSVTSQLFNSQPAAKILNQVGQASVVAPPPPRTSRCRRGRSPSHRTPPARSAGHLLLLDYIHLFSLIAHIFFSLITFDIGPQALVP